MNKKWAEDYSSDEGSVGENDIQSDEDVIPAPAHMQKQTLQAQRYNVTPPTEKMFFAIHVSDIDYSQDRKAVGTFFESAGCKLTNLVLNPDEKRGTASIKFADKASLDIGLGLNGAAFHGRNIKVFMLTGNEIVPGGRSDNNATFVRRASNDTREKGPQRGDRDPRGRGKGSFSDGRGGGGFNDRGDVRRGGSAGGGKIQQTTNRQSAATTNNSGIAGSGAVIPPEVPTRPKLNLQPRSLPLEAIGQPVVKRNIFGEGRPQDEAAYEEHRKKEITPAAGLTTTETAPCDVSKDATVFEFAALDAAVQEVDGKLPVQPAATENAVGADVKRDGSEGNFTKNKKVSGTGGNKGPPAVEGGKVFKARGGDDGRQLIAGGRGGGRVANQGRGGQAGRGSASVSGGAVPSVGFDAQQPNSKNKSQGKLVSNSKLFQSAVHQTGGPGDKNSKRPGNAAASTNPSSASATATGASSSAVSGTITSLTDEERFQRAQETFKAGSQTVSVSNKPKVTPGGFAALGFSEDEDESDA